MRDTPLLWISCVSVLSNSKSLAKNTLKAAPNFFLLKMLSISRETFRRFVSACSFYVIILLSIEDAGHPSLIPRRYYIPPDEFELNTWRVHNLVVCTFVEHYTNKLSGELSISLFLTECYLVTQFCEARQRHFLEITEQKLAMGIEEYALSSFLS